MLCVGQESRTAESFWWQLKEHGLEATRDSIRSVVLTSPQGCIHQGHSHGVIQGEFNRGVICKGVGGRLANQKGSDGTWGLGLKE